MSYPMYILKGKCKFPPIEIATRHHEFSANSPLN
ncbi:hypothetical protein CAEBREN_07336 [Caenorhabditis brenneri]|uniref:Uncharacterized protein n=1 Tax=Caenorhabditis brenneri TaxID=135651 RepID=G0N656_CAEBE|nr:hypothetical protein CAEBREN_07336 [Caenorhabditis brenneri]